MYTKSLIRVCTISGMGWINCSNFWRAKRIKSRIFNTALSCNNCKTYSHKPSPSENMKTDLKTYSFTSKCLIDTNTPHLSNTLLCYPSPIILIRYVGFAILLWSYIAQHSDTLIDWSSDSSLYPTFPFSCHFYILTPYYSTVSIIECEILNIQLARTNRHSEMATMLFQKSQIIISVKSVHRDVLNETLGPSERRLWCYISTKILSDKTENLFKKMPKHYHLPETTCYEGVFNITNIINDKYISTTQGTIIIV